MVGYMCLEEQVDADFSRARRKALLRRMRARLRRDSASDGLLLRRSQEDPRGDGEDPSGLEDGAGCSDWGQRRQVFRVR
jgi:hypothetical protein